MLAALRKSLRPAPAPSDTGNDPGPSVDDLPDAARVEADLLAAKQTETAAQPGNGDFRISVTDRGAPCFEDRFDAGEIVIGADPECDIVITDIDAAEVLVLRLEKIGSAGMITLTALCNGVFARDRELPVGRPVRFPDRAQFSVAADYGFSVDLSPRRESPARAPSGPAVLLTGALLLALAGWLLSMPLPRPDAPEPTRVATPPTESVSPQRPEAAGESGQIETPRDERRITVPPAAQEPTAEPPPEPAAGDAVPRLRARLVDANLVPPLIVSAEGDGILVSGALSAGERDRAIDVMQAFREANSIDVTIEIAAEPRESPFFTAVVLRPETFAIGADGRRYGEGQSLPDGGRIEKIDEKAIVVNRDGLRERVIYTW